MELLVSTMNGSRAAWNALMKRSAPAMAYDLVRDCWVI
jgi:hypothetical protein